MTHDAHEYQAPDPCDYEDAWHDLLEHEADVAYENMSPAEQGRWLLEKLQIRLKGTPLHLEDR